MCVGSTSLSQTSHLVEDQGPHACSGSFSFKSSQMTGKVVLVPKAVLWAVPDTPTGQSVLVLLESGDF